MSAAVAHILEEMGIKSIRLMTNNPRKITEMAALGIPVSGRIPCLVRCAAACRAVACRAVLWRAPPCPAVLRRAVLTGAVPWRAALFCSGGLHVGNVWHPPPC